MVFLIMLKHKPDNNFVKYKEALLNSKFDWIISSECQLDLDKDIRVNQRHYVSSNRRSNMLLSNVVAMYSKLESITIKTFMDKYNRLENPIEENIYNLIKTEKNISDRYIDRNSINNEPFKSSIQSYKDKILHCGQFDIIRGDKKAYM